MPHRESQVLIVDDDRVNREILLEVLDGEGYRLFTAVDGLEALAALNEPGNQFDTILLDRMMPGLDGIEVLRQIKQDDRLSSMPVIMRTAAAARNQVIEGIKAGAFYYLTKPFDLEIVRSLVRSAVSAARTHESLRLELEQNRILIGLMDRAQFTIRAPAEARRLAVLLASTAPNPRNAVLGLYELLLNAIEHGNLALDYADKSRLRASGEWEAEVTRRLAAPEFSARTVSVEYRRAGSTREVLITDQGAGFDWKPFLQIDAKRAFDTHGRGIALARALSFDQIEYLGTGNRVRARFAPSSAGQPLAATGHGDAPSRIGYASSPAKRTVAASA